MLRIIDLAVSYGHIKAVKNIGMKVSRSELVTIIGANGSGKSTIMKAIMGVLGPSNGKIEFLDTPIHHFRPHQIVRMGISLVKEGRGIFHRLTVQENLEIGAYSCTSRRSEQSNLRLIYDKFPILSERRRQLAGSLSGGEQQILAISRALMAKPKLLLLDEPSLGLAPQKVQEVFFIVRGLKEEGLTILLVEQNARMALSYADFGYVLETGCIVLTGTGQQLMENPKVQEAYLGMRRK